MKIAIDARALLGERTGIGTYTHGIAGGLARRAGVEVGLFSPRPVDGDRGGSGPWSVHAGRHPVGMLWVQADLDRRAARWGADALLAALTIGPVRGRVPLVSVVHDLTPWTHPEWHAARTLAGFLPLWEKTAERASRLICVSQATARELSRRYPEVEPRVRVVPHGVEPELAPDDDPARLTETRRRHCAGRPYILYLGTLEPRKNVGALLAACERLWTEDRARPDLVLAGGAGWKGSGLARAIADSPFREKIHLPGYADRETARRLYQAAEVFVYPSFAEGFGLPVLEAMACGAPVVASTAEALREVAGDAALYAEPRDEEGLARQIARVLDEKTLSAAMRRAGRERAASFTWEKAAGATLEVLEEASRENRGES